MRWPPPVEKLITALGRLPGVGRRSAERMALRLVRDDAAHLVRELTNALGEVSQQVCSCGRCGSLTLRQANPCELCTNPARDDRLLCVVEQPGDIAQLEQTGEYKGRYFALMGRLSPMRGEGPRQLRIEALIERVKQGGVGELLLALNPDVEGDATAAYLVHLLEDAPVRVTRLAFGLPAGSALEYSDPITLGRALQGRREV